MAPPLIQSVNPATEEVVRRFDPMPTAQIDAAIAGADAAFRAWRRTGHAERAAGLRRLAAVLRGGAGRYARLITLEMGKPIAEAEAEVEKCAWNCDFYAEHGARFLADKLVPTGATRSLVAFEPLGVVLAIMPWNFPFWQVVRFLAPALAAGNAALLKHASNVPQCALAIEEAVLEAGFPPGLFRTLLVGGRAVEPVIADDRVRAVTLTGSSETGARVAELAGRALKKCVLELGGSDPFIVLADADLNAAAATAARARNQNGGQSCIAAKRFLVERGVAEEFTALFARAVAALRVGDPFERATQVGPLARGDLRVALARQVDEAVAAGAELAVGGRARPGKGYFYEPTVLGAVTDRMSVFAEETFGPVGAVRAVADLEEALDVANASQYGLGASLWTRDLERAEAAARRIESGAVFVNSMVASDPRLPFGGVKRSGYGRELSSFGIREFTNVQAISIVAAGPAEGPAAE